jgi:hypothetical protein
VALELILGPAHAGKIAELYGRYLDALDAGREAVLVVPDEATRRTTEQELLRRRPALIGADAVTFDRLFERTLRRVGDGRSLLVGPARTVVLRRLFGGAAEDLGARFDRLGSALLDPTAVAEAGEAELAAQYTRWWEELGALGVVDRGRLRLDACAALTRDVAAWPAGAALFAQGFDDLSPAQEHLVVTIGQRAQAVLSLPYEAGRPVFAALAPAVARLIEAGGSAAITDLPARDQGRSAGLVALERRLAEPDPDARADDPDGRDQTIVDAEGERAEAEAVAAAIAAALRAGTPGGRIAIVAPHGARGRGRLLRQLRETGIPVAADVAPALPATPFGRALLALLRIAWTDATDADRLTWLRSPWSGAPPHLVERLERLVRRSLDDLPGAIARNGPAIAAALEPPEGVLDLPTPLAQARAAVAGMLRRAHGLAAPAPDRALEADLEVARAVLRVLDDPQLARLDPTRDEVREILTATPVAGRAIVADAVRILAPSAARTLDADLVVVLGLEDPLFGVATGAAAGALLDEPDADQVALHLLYMAVTRPREQVLLVRRSADDDGSPLAPSALWETLLDARGRGGTHLRRRFQDAVHPLAEAPTARERLRSLAAQSATDPAGARAIATRLDLRLPLERALDTHRSDTALRDPRVLEPIRSRSPIGVTEIDRFGECSQIWFVERRLNPVEIDQPIDDRRRMGTLAHTVLARLYREGPARLGTTAIGADEADRIPAEIDRLLDEELAKIRVADEDDALALRLAAWGLRRDLTRLALRAARSPSPLQPSVFEVQFGGRTAQKGYKQGLDVGPAAVSGKIDRIDTDPLMTARAVVVDYKSGGVQGASTIRKDGHLQLPLYLLALREVLGREPVGGVYVSVRRGEIRGLLDAEHDDVLPTGTTPSDHLDHDTFEEVLEEARAEAAARIERMHRGDVRHDPRDLRLCRDLCAYAGICRVPR